MISGWLDRTGRKLEGWARTPQGMRVIVIVVILLLIASCASWAWDGFPPPLLPQG